MCCPATLIVRNRRRRRALRPAARCSRIRIAGLLDGRRALTHPPCSFAPLHQRSGRLRAAKLLRVDSSPASACCSLTTCGTPERRFSDAPSSSSEAGGRVIATVEIFDRMEAIVDLGVPNYALAEYAAPENYPAAECPMCREGMPITTF